MSRARATRGGGKMQAEKELRKFCFPPSIVCMLGKETSVSACVFLPIPKSRIPLQQSRLGFRHSFLSRFCCCCNARINVGDRSKKRRAMIFDFISISRASLVLRRDRFGISDHVYGVVVPPCYLSLSLMRHTTKTGKSSIEWGRRGDEILSARRLVKVRKTKAHKSRRV